MFLLYYQYKNMKKYENKIFKKIEKSIFEITLKIG
jgi:hypothetical protein